MCYRFVRESKLVDIAREFGISEIDSEFKPSYNVAPTQTIPAVIHDSTRRIALFRWGLIPPWAKDISIGNKMLNARAETVTVKPSFRLAFKKRRCLIPASGYYEWRKENDKKIPVYIHLKTQSVFGMAGMWEQWHSPEGDSISSCTILTIASNERLKPIHERMPVIIPKNKTDFWLDQSMKDENQLVQLLKPYDHEQMNAYDVATVINSPRNDSPDNIQPAEQTGLDL